MPHIERSRVVDLAHDVSGRLAPVCEHLSIDEFATTVERLVRTRRGWERRATKSTYEEPSIPDAEFSAIVAAAVETARATLIAT